MSEISLIRETSTFKKEETIATNRSTSTVADPFLTKLFGEYEFNRYGIIGMLLIAVVCTSGIAIALGAMLNMVQVGFLAVSTLICLTFILAVSPMRLIIYSGMISLLVSVSIILINLV